MTDPIQLLYEEILLEDTEESSTKRIAYLRQKYKAKLEQLIPALDWQTEVTIADEAPKDIVDHVDPTHGKYSEWILRTFMSYLEARLNQADSVWPRAQMYKGGAQQHVPSMLYWGWLNEDSTKTTQDLRIFDKYKHKLPPDQRDINRYNFVTLSQAIEPFTKEDRELSYKELATRIKEEETTKLFSNYKGWTLVVPKTADSARLYGANTRWCTAAREDDDNYFEDYDANGPLFIFIHGNDKFQWWTSLDHLDDEVEFNNSHDEYANIMDIPRDIWLAAIRAPTQNVRIRKALNRMMLWVRAGTETAGEEDMAAWRNDEDEEDDYEDDII